MKDVEPSAARHDNQRVGDEHFVSHRYCDGLSEELELFFDTQHESKLVR